MVHLGSHIETADHYRRLMAARPAFLMFVDTRYPADAVTADGMFPAYVHRFGAVPTVSVAYQDAWNGYAAGASAARLCVIGGMRDSTSQNVIGELAGSDPSAGVLYVGAHHDTQADSVGADDNGTGVAAVLALAGALARAAATPDDPLDQLRRRGAVVGRQRRRTPGATATNSPRAAASCSTSTRSARCWDGTTSSATGPTRWVPSWRVTSRPRTSSSR